MKRALTFLTIVLLFADCKQEIDLEPTADFTVQNNNCKAPCEVVFTSTAKNATNYLWEFGNGQTATEPNPRHTYTSIGVYEVTLTVNGADGSNTTSQQVRINLYQKVWDKAFGGTNKETYTTMMATADGGFLLAGSPQLPMNVANRSEVDFNVMKVGADGVTQWKKTFGGSQYDELTSAIASADGGFLLGGTSESPASGDKSQPKIGVRDIWVVKIGADGTRQWDKAYGRKELYSELRTIEATNDSHFRLLGNIHNNVWDFSNDSYEYFDCLQIKLGPDGNIKEASNHCNYLPEVTIPAGGHVIRDSFVYRDYGVIKVGADGARQWQKTFGGSGDDNLQTIVATPDGGYLLGGVSNSIVSGDKTENTRGLTDYWIVKIDANGTKVWDKTFGGVSRDGLTHLIATPDGGFLLGGTSESPPSGDKSGSSGVKDFWVIKLQ